MANYRGSPRASRETVQQNDGSNGSTDVSGRESSWTCCRVLLLDGRRPGEHGAGRGAARGRGAAAESAYLRIYGWAVPTLSLGYFQRWPRSVSDPSMAGTAGGAAADRRGGDLAPSRGDLRDRRPAELPLVRPNTALYRAVHGAIAGPGGTGHPGPPTGGERPGARECAERPLLCFTDRDPEDIVAVRSKSWGARSDDVGVRSSSMGRSCWRVARRPGAARRLRCGGRTRSRRIGQEPLRERITAALDLQPMAIGVPDELRDRAWSWMQRDLSQRRLDGGSLENRGPRGSGTAPFVSRRGNGRRSRPVGSQIRAA